MTHIPGKRLPRPGAALAAVTALVATLGLGLAGEAKAATPAEAAAPFGDDRPHGFASRAGGATSGTGGRVVTVTDRASLARYAPAPEPYVNRVAGSIAVEPFASDTLAASHKAVVGVGDTGEIVHGELHPNPGTHHVVIRNLTIRDSCVEGDRDGRTTGFDAPRGTDGRAPYARR
ncbi:hypothetical protein [Streptomyces eurythermus]|uniref:hypothetical protein n=1 Tax=Streptomyces eurythermus TaxID=42237 RepID=UPI0036D42D12